MVDQLSETQTGVSSCRQMAWQHLSTAVEGIRNLHRTVLSPLYNLPPGPYRGTAEVRQIYYFHVQTCDTFNNLNFNELRK